jgi:hypothetical protein
VFRNKELVRPHIGFRNEYRRFLRKDWNWGNLKPTWDLRKTAVWTSDAFYPIMYRPDFFGELSHGYMIQPSSTRGPAKVKIIQRQKRNNAGRGYAITGWDMEASSLFSAREVHKLKVTAALVVSWSSSHWISLGNNGITGRNQNHKKTAHAVEHSLIAAAVEYLFV